MLKYIVITIVLVVIDQVSKLLAVKKLDFGEEIALFPGLNFSLAYNEGAAFGMLANQNGWQRWFFLAIAIIVIISILIWIYKSSKAGYRLECAALTLVLSGAIGNLIDRALYGHVIDFIDFYIKSWHWYTFNIADSFICIGASIIIINYLFGVKK